jgi:hypothetical protein
MIRGLKTVESELAQVEAILGRSGEVTDMLDNDGNVAMTAAEVVRSYQRRAVRLRQEEADLRRIFRLPKEGA